MRIKNRWWALIGISLFVCLPAILIPPSVEYKRSETKYEWGVLIFTNTALGAYAGDDVFHQITIKVRPFAVQDKQCQTSSNHFTLKHGNKDLPWKTGIVSNFDDANLYTPKPPTTLMFVNRKEDESAIAIDAEIEFTLSEGCLKSGIYKYEHKFEPKKYRYWIWNIVFDAFMSV